MRDLIVWSMASTQPAELSCSDAGRSRQSISRPLRRGCDALAFALRFQTIAAVFQTQSSDEHPVPLAELPRPRRNPVSESFRRVRKSFGKDAPGNARASAHPRQFLQRAQLVVGLLAEQLRPVGVGDLGHVDIATGIDRDAVRGNELPGGLAQRLRPEPR